MDVKSSNDSSLTLACHNEIAGLRESTIITINYRIFVNESDSGIMRNRIGYEIAILEANKRIGVQNGLFHWI